MAPSPSGTRALAARDARSTQEAALAEIEGAAHEAGAPRLAEQLRFLVAVDALKAVERRTRIQGGLRRENSAEHSWHAALAALLLAEHGPPGADRGRALRLLLVHDLVEIEAGDTFCYDDAALADQADRERDAAASLFGLLPEDQAAEMRALWEEFEARRSPEARLAQAVDRVLPLLHNLLDGGGTWRENGVTADRVRGRVAPLEDASPALHALVSRLLERAVADGRLSAAPDATP